MARLNSNDSVPGLTLPNKQQTKKSNTSVHLNVGVIVQDRVPPEEIKIIRVPLRKSNAAMNLSDEAFESMGDTVEDVLDTSHAEILTGDDVKHDLSIIALSLRGQFKD